MDAAALAALSNLLEASPATWIAIAIGARIVVLMPIAALVTLSGEESSRS